MLTSRQFYYATIALAFADLRWLVTPSCTRSTPSTFVISATFCPTPCCLLVFVKTRKTAPCRPSLLPPAMYLFLSPRRTRSYCLCWSPTIVPTSATRKKDPRHFFGVSNPIMSSTTTIATPTTTMTTTTTTPNGKNDKMTG